MGKPHIHAEIIKAWADGAEIQINKGNKGWVDIGWPNWGHYDVYRIKHEEKKKSIVRWLWAGKNISGEWIQYDCFFTENEAQFYLHRITGHKNWIKLEYSRTEFLE